MHYQKTIQAVREKLTDMHVQLTIWCSLPHDTLHAPTADGSWNIIQILEHISLTNHFLLIIIRKGRDKALRRLQEGVQISEEESDLDALVTIGQRGTFTWIRPEHMEPTGNLSIAEINEKLDQQYLECLSILDSFPSGVGTLYQASMSVQSLGKLDLYQWLYFLALHQQRHIAQMESVLQSRGDSDVYRFT